MQIRKTFPANLSCTVGRLSWQIFVQLKKIHCKIRFLFFRWIQNRANSVDEILYTCTVCSVIRVDSIRSFCWSYFLTRGFETDFERIGRLSRRWAISALDWAKVFFFVDLNETMLFCIYCILARFFFLRRVRRNVYNEILWTFSKLVILSNIVRCIWYRK